MYQPYILDAYLRPVLPNVSTRYIFHQMFCSVSIYCTTCICVYKECIPVFDGNEHRHVCIYSSTALTIAIDTHQPLGS